MRMYISSLAGPFSIPLCNVIYKNMFKYLKKRGRLERASHAMTNYRYQLVISFFFSFFSHRRIFYPVCRLWTRSLRDCSKDICLPYRINLTNLSGRINLNSKLFSEYLSSLCLKCIFRFEDHFYNSSTIGFSRLGISTR